MTSYQPDPVALFRRRLHTQDRISNMPNAPRTVKDVPAQEFVIALAQYFRSTGKDDAVRLTPPTRMTLEQAIAYIDNDEMVEVTPESIRLRKALLDPHERKRASRAAG